MDRPRCGGVRRREARSATYRPAEGRAGERGDGYLHLVGEDRHHRVNPDEGGALSRWARAAIGLGGDPPLPRPTTPRLDPVRRSWIGAFWQARIGVRAGMTLDDFLRSRLARYLAGLPVPRARLPLLVDIADGQLSVRAAPEPSPTVRTADAEPWIAPLVAIEGPAARQELAQLEVRLAMLDGEIGSARHRVEELSRKLAADISSGIVMGPPDVDATAEQLGRPPVRSAAPRTLAVGFAVAALAAETWQVAQPLLRSAGIDPASLGTEALRRPADVAFASVFSLGVAAGIFALAHAALTAALALFRGDADDRRRRWLASAAIGAGGGAVLLAAAVAALPAPVEAPHPPPTSFVLLLVSVPLTVALIARAVARADEQRALEIGAALAWDRERARALGERARRLEELAWAEEEERALERQRDAARRRLREVNVRAGAAARIAAEAERRERAALARLAQSLVGALELDRYEFVRQASARGSNELVASRRRRETEPRPAFDETTAPVAAGVEAGRLAS